MHIARQYDRVYYPCRRKDYNSVRSFFLLQPKIEVVPIDTDSPHPNEREIKAGSGVLRLGFYFPGGMDKGFSFAENFYFQAGVSYDVRWDECPIQEVVDTFYSFELHGKNSGWRQPINFIHDDPARGFCLKGEYGTFVKPIDIGSSILAFAGLMYSAEHIALIDGPFLHLAESIETHGELFYHKYARPLSARWNDIDCPTRKKWTILT